MKRTIVLPLALSFSLLAPNLGMAMTPSIADRVQERLQQRLSGESTSSSSSSSLNPRPRTAAPSSSSAAPAQRNRQSIRDRILQRMLRGAAGTPSSASSSSITRTRTPWSSPSVSSSSSARSRVTSPPTDTAGFALEVLSLVNQERATEGLPALKRNALLERSAQKYAEVMRQDGHFDHAGPDGRSPTDRIKAEGYPDVPACNCNRQYYYGENIARGQTTPAQVVRDWMNSAGHRANILSKNYKEIGIGISGTYWAQSFGGVWER